MARRGMAGAGPDVMRVGLGWDIHRLAVGRPLMLAGVAVPSPAGAVGDSDADVVLHAVIDGVLGAMAWGDIGTWFPRAAVAAGQPSGPLLAEVMEHLAAAGGAVVQVDVTIVLEAPRLADYRPAVIGSLAQQLGCRVVSVKFKTQDGLGDVGRGEAVACWASVMVDA